MHSQTADFDANLVGELFLVLYLGFTTQGSGSASAEGARPGRRARRGWLHAQQPFRLLISALSSLLPECRNQLRSGRCLRSPSTRLSSFCVRVACTATVVPLLSFAYLLCFLLFVLFILTSLLHCRDRESSRHVRPGSMKFGRTLQGVW